MAAFIKHELAGLWIPVKPVSDDTGIVDVSIFSFSWIDDANADAEGYLSDWKYFFLILIYI